MSSLERLGLGGLWPYAKRCSPAAALGTADIESAIREVERVARKGFRILTLPCKPIFGSHDVAHINYNLPVFDPLWAAIQDTDLPICCHIRSCSRRTSCCSGCADHATPTCRR